MANAHITAIIALHPGSELSATVQALKAAESYSLHADTTCGLNCPASINQQSTGLKRAFLAMFNPIAARYGAPTHTVG